MIFEVKCDERRTKNERRTYGLDAHTYCLFYKYRCAYPGLFPPAGPQVWDPQLPWQPIPVHTVPLDQEYLLNKMHAFCPR